MRYVILALAILLGSAFSSQTQAQVQLRITLGSPGVNLGPAMSNYPTLVRIPGYPVYYDPRAESNYFFYDGLYWVYQDDNWYSSTWYDGPWDRISPAYVPLFVLRVPVRYYRRPPVYFRGWRADSAPRWGQHWGHDWERQRRGWDHWNRRAVPRAAPLPIYQRHYTGNHYPRQFEQQRSIDSRSNRYQPREAVSRQIRDQRHQDAQSRDRQQQQQRNDRQQQQQRAQHQQHSQPAQGARGHDNKDRKGRTDNSKKDNNKDRKSEHKGGNAG